MIYTKINSCSLYCPPNAKTTCKCYSQPQRAKPAQNRKTVTMEKWTRTRVVWFSRVWLVENLWSTAVKENDKCAYTTLWSPCDRNKLLFFVWILCATDAPTPSYDLNLGPRLIIRTKKRIIGLIPLDNCIFILVTSNGRVSSRTGVHRQIN